MIDATQTTATCKLRAVSHRVLQLRDALNAGIARAWDDAADLDRRCKATLCKDEAKTLRRIYRAAVARRRSLEAQLAQLNGSHCQ